MRVRQALGRQDVSIEEVVRIVGAEPSLSVRLLQLANSSAVNPAGQRVTTLRTAITRMGFSLARSATIAFAMSQMRRAESWRGLQPQFRDIWESCARLAAASYSLARHKKRADADQALLAGMLHAVGKLFVLTRVSRFPALMADAAISAEIDNVWRARASRALLARWELPADVIQAACDFDQASAAGEGPASLADVLLSGHYLAGVHDASGLAGAAFLSAACFARLGLDAAGATQVLLASTAEIASLRAALAD
jgi:HD-like signal output (HDOD) protein